MRADDSKAQFRGEITSSELEAIRATCLFVATILGDYAEETVVVGGLVPSLLISQPPLGAEHHAGTRDLDLGLSLAVLDDDKYKAISSRLRGAGFEPDVSDKGRLIRQRWRLTTYAVTVDFLLPPLKPNTRAGSVQSLEKDFAAVVIPGLQFAFVDYSTISLSGLTVKGERAERDIKVCGPGAFVVLKALAFSHRGERKDAYDLAYMIRNYGAGPVDVAERLKSIRHEYEVKKAIEVLKRDFSGVDHLGPIRATEFSIGISARDEQLQADIVTAVRKFLKALK
jgi:predicted nucleotidyltransferase